MLWVLCLLSRPGAQANRLPANHAEEDVLVRNGLCQGEPPVRIKVLGFRCFKRVALQQRQLDRMRVLAPAPQLPMP